MSGRPEATGAARVGAVLVLTALLVSGAGVLTWNSRAVRSTLLRPHCTATVSGISTELDPEQTGNAAIIAAAANRRQLPARAVSIGIATAIRESKLHNIDYGDRDSLGLFQQRPSQGWGSARQVQDPVYASNAFFDVLVKIEGYQDLTITDAAQKVQRSAHPAAYGVHEPQARILASSLTGHSPATLNCVLTTAQGAQQALTANGLTPRATTLVSAATRETGHKGAAATADGASVRFALTGRDSRRLSWALAQWAVARADALSVVSVYVDGKQWQRDDPEAGWTTADEDPAAGTVVVGVVNG